METIPRNTPEWNAEHARLQEILIRWRNDSSNRDIQQEIGLSLDKLGYDLSHHDRSPEN